MSELTIASYAVLTFPEPHIVLLSLTAPPMNQANTRARQETHKAVKWYDNEPELWIMIITGAKGSKAFSAGADLKEWLELYIPAFAIVSLSSFPGVLWSSGEVLDGGSFGTEVDCRKRKGTDGESMGQMTDGFCGISQRRGQKPIIAAVNGRWDGNGSELVRLSFQWRGNNSDLVIASEKASFALPEVKRGVFAKAGALGRIIRFIGLQRASELALLGDPISPQKMQEWGIVNAVVPHERLIPTALSYARKICQNSPDAVIVSKTGMLMSLEHGSVERGTQLHNESREVKILENGENIKEGLLAFNEKRGPNWRSSKI